MIYLDNNATTQASESVLSAVVKYMSKCFSNASATTAAFTGADIPRRNAASQMAKILNAEEPETFFFTSGATEANNWVFASIAATVRTGTILISSIEHPSVREPAERLSRQGFNLQLVPVDSHGVVCLEALGLLLSPDVVLVSIMAANNETGVLQSIGEIGKLVRDKAPTALFHTDATQAVGKIAIDLQKEWKEVDLLSFSAHKFNGPKGVGGLYCRPGIDLTPLLVGGGQEQGARSGTTNTPGLAGLAAAVNEIELTAFGEVRQKRDYLEQQLLKLAPILIHSVGAPRLPNTCCFSIPECFGDDLVTELAAQGIIVGSGSACSSGSQEPAQTLLAMGVDYQVALGTIRVSLGPTTSVEELDFFLDRLKKTLMAS